MRPARKIHLFASVAVAAGLALAAAGCSTTGETTGSIDASPAPRSEAEWRRSLDELSARYREDPNNVEVAIAYSQALRATEQRAQAVAVLEQASIRNPQNMPLLGAYGRALADAGQYQQALQALSRAHTPDNPDWRILNAQGAVLDQMGRHSDAQSHYRSALKIAPDESSVLSNLGLSYALQKDLKQAETLLRRAAARPGAGPKVRQNLALVVGLQGRFDEAERIAAAELPEAEAATNVNYLRQMLAEQGGKRTAKRPIRLSPDTGS